jgi:cell wall-associated NlpC family hydrolase
MKRLLLVGSLVAALTSCSASAGAQQVNTQLNTVSNTAQYGPFAAIQTVVSLGAKGLSSPASRTLLERQQRSAQKLNRNYLKIQSVVKRLKKTAGKTWYVFSGASPRGWDCSGLVRWTYEQLGVTLEHSATKQLHSGKHVKKPKVGDIVAFSYPGSSGSFHVGIYIGNGKVIHAYSYGKRTVIQSVAKVRKENGNAKVTYIRILESAKLPKATL